MISLPKEEYRWIKAGIDEEDKIKQAYLKSDKTLLINWETGEFAGKIEDVPFEGKFNILKVQSGFTKGFNYELSLDALSYESVKGKSAEKFLHTISTCTSIFVGPDRLYKPVYTKLTFKSPTDSMVMVLLN